MKKYNYLPALIISLAVLSSCEKIDVLPRNATNEEVNSYNSSTTTAPSIITVACEKTVSNFYAGQHMLAGTITVENDAVNLYVTFHTTSGWLMQQTHLYVGPLSGLPSGSNGNPKIGNFPFSASHNPKVTDYTYTIPLTKFSSNCMVIAAHAEVVQLSSDGTYVNGQTAWGAGKQISPRGSWASYFDYCICQPTTDDNGDGGTDTEGKPTDGSSGDNIDG